MRLKIYIILQIVFLGTMSVYGQHLDPGGTDYEALKAFYQATNGDSWTSDLGWDFSGDVSVNKRWAGVEITNERVTTINISNNNVTGTIPPEAT